MADISNVRYEEIKDITESLEALSCTYLCDRINPCPITNVDVSLACIMTRVLY